MKRLTIGILAHVDSGKTTLCEALLYTTGATRKLGRVDHGDAYLDTDAQERERGITIWSKEARLTAGDCELTLLDTPGHVDFSPEAERVLQVLDCAILVINGAEGVQSHTLTLWRLLEKHDVPVFLYINKMDLSGYTKEELMAQLRRHLSEACIDFTPGRDPEERLEDIISSDELLMHFAFSEHGFAEKDIPRAVMGRHCFPCLFGSALRMQGVEELVDAIRTYGEEPEYPAEFAAKVYKVSTDSRGERVTHMKITGGVLNRKDMVMKLRDGETLWSEKVNELRLLSGTKSLPCATAEAGTIVAATGLTQAQAGDGLGAEPDSPACLLEPVLIYRICFPEGTNLHEAARSFRTLSEEEPMLRIHWIEQTRELLCELMGEVQIEVLTRRVKERFGYDITFLPVSIAYRETIAAPVEGVGHYEPLRHYAEVHVLLEPLPAGRGMEFRSALSEDVLDRNWQRLILTHFREKKHLGVLTGSPLTDVRITLIAGKAHLKHTEGGDFRQATYRAIRQGLMQAQSVLLEPWYSFRLTVPQEQIGRALNDLTMMKATFSAPEIIGDTAFITGTAAVRHIRNYQKDLIAYTHGKGMLSTAPSGYRPSGDQDEIVAAIGYDPEADLANTPDSVFCDHGAGFNVKWNEVPQYMHLDSGWRKDGYRPMAQEAAPRPQPKKALSPLEEDAALIKIFEQTYGPIKRNPLIALRSQKRREETVFADAAPKTEYLLVDGYNILFAWEELKKTAETNIDAARAKLADILSNYQGYTGCRLILVFDAYRVKGNAGTVEQYHNICIVYTKEAETADAFIERATYTLAKERRVRVATSDGPEQMIILGNGAERVPAKQFKEEVLAVEKSILSMLGGKKATFSLGALSELVQAQSPAE
ncbi:MAG: TetM/TetW/TetO/TetS family tetracycline resistance ribosomal protection protein [Clostridia bacterium]|nr:TetM/TetW/TetO/TetS family tetracycline resistance ribosomal protection protein [Clostridia bacterium]